MLIIGLGSKARQGKDSAAHAIQNYYLNFNNGFSGVTTGIFKFATALYQEVNKYLEVLTRTNKFGRTLSTEDYSWQNFYAERDVRIPEWVQPEPNAEVSELAPYGKHPKLLQWWGTNFRREQDADYWTKKLFVSIPNNIQIALITDVRFPNEAQGIKDRGGYLVNVQRINEDGSQYVAPDRPADHPSEVALDNWNWDAFIKSKNPELTGSLALTICAHFKRIHDKA
jgi:hypothetical protein